LTEIGFSGPVSKFMCNIVPSNVPMPEFDLEIVDDHAFSEKDVYISLCYYDFDNEPATRLLLLPLACGDRVYVLPPAIERPIPNMCFERYIYGQRLGDESKGWFPSAILRRATSPKHKWPLKPFSALNAQRSEQLFTDIKVVRMESTRKCRFLRVEPHRSRISRMIQKFNNEHNLSIELYLAELEPTDESAREGILKAIGECSPMDDQELPEHDQQLCHLLYVACTKDDDSKLKEEGGRKVKQLFCLGLPRSEQTNARQLIESMFLENGCFDKESNQSKRVCRMNLFFKDTVPTIESFTLTCTRDIERNGYKFTEGCGRISEGLLQQVKQRYIELEKPPLDEEERINKASIVQIRVLLYKAIVALDPKLCGSQLMMPKSARKLCTPNIDKHVPDDQPVQVEGVPIEVVKFASESVATCCQQVLQLLDWNSNTAKQQIEQHQKQEIDNWCSLVTKPDANLMKQLFKALANSRSQHQPHQLVQRKLAAGFDPKKDTHLHFYALQTAKEKILESSRKPSLPKGSRAWHAMIVPDWTGKLPEGSAYCEFAAEYLGLDNCEEDHYCAVAKSPSYEPGNLRRLKLVRRRHYPWLNHLTGCIVLSIQGARPEADKMFGADYDGDECIIIVGPELVPREFTPEPQEYRHSQITTPKSDLDIFRDMKEFLRVNWTHQLGRIDHALLRIAAEGADMIYGDEYKQLAVLFSEEVDAKKAGKHVSPHEIQNLLSKALGKPRMRYKPAFLLYDNKREFRLKYKMQGGQEFDCNTLINRIFKNAKQAYEQIMDVESKIHVRALDQDLLSMWEQCEEEALLEAAIKFQDTYFANKEAHANNMPNRMRRNKLREKALNDAHMQAKYLGVEFDVFALALYIAKYKRLLDEGGTDNDGYPWEVVGEALVSIKERAWAQSKYQLADNWSRL